MCNIIAHVQIACVCEGIYLWYPMLCSGIHNCIALATTDIKVGTAEVLGVSTS